MKTTLNQRKSKIAEIRFFAGMNGKPGNVLGPDLRVRLLSTATAREIDFMWDTPGAGKEC
jgi:hypothetical protein